MNIYLPSETGDRGSGTIDPPVFRALGYIQGYLAGRGAGQMMESHIHPVCLPQQFSVEECESRSRA